MFIPKHIKFMGQLVDVEKVGEAGIPGLAGQYTEWFGRIRLAESSEQLMAITFMHEIVEMINAIFELGLEHEKISTLASSLFAVIRDNRLNFYDTCEW